MERLWEVPSSWEWTVIKELGGVVSGATPSTKVRDYWDGDVIWFAPSDLTGYKQKFIARGAKTLTEEGLANSSARIIPAGSVMFSSRAPVGYVAINSVPAATNQGFKSVVPYTGLFEEYLYHYLKASKQMAEQRATGTTFKELSGAAFGVLPVPVPPTNEQRRIVEKIEALFDEIDKGVESLKTAKTTLGLYRQSLLKSAFEGRLTADWRKRDGRDEANWPETDLGDHIEFLTSGSRGWAKYYSQDGELFIRAQNLKHDRLCLDDVAFVSLPTATAEGTRTRVRAGDVLITITGANVTKTGLVEDDPGTAYVSQHVALCRLLPTVVPRFVWYFLVAQTGGRKQLEEAAYGAGKPGLNLSNIREVRIPICSPDEQAEIVRLLDARLDAADALEAEIDAALTRASALRQSILKKAFSGQLVPQDPGDEPAAALLARIRAERAKAPKAARKRKALA